MGKFKAWQHTTGATKIEAPKEKDLADRFDKEFTELFEVVPKANRRALIDMLKTINGLVTFESWRSAFVERYGLERGMEYANKFGA